MDCNWLVYITIAMYDYFFWKNFFNKEELKELNNICNLKNMDNFKDNNGAYSNTKGKLKNVDNVNCIQWKYVKSILQKALDEIEISNQFNYGYSLYNFNDLDTILFNTYKKNDFYDWHKDGSNQSCYDIKFTVLINSSLKNYQGGNFQLFSYGGENTIKEFDESGTLLMFKSDIPHRVLPITNGIRNSIVFFMKGPKFV